MPDKTLVADLTKKAATAVKKTVVRESTETVKSVATQIGFAPSENKSEKKSDGSGETREMVKGLYAPEKKLDQNEYQKLASQDSSSSNERISQIRSELGGGQPDAKGAKSEKTGEERRIQIEHHREAEELGVERQDARQIEAQKKQQEEEEKKKKAELEKQKLEQPVEVQGKAPGGMPKRKKMTRPPMIKRPESKAGKGGE